MRLCNGISDFISRLLFGFLCLSLIGAGNARAAYPDHPVRIIVGYPAGGSTDIVARIIGNWLSQKLGQQFIVENKPGAGNNIGTELVTKAAPDGYTLLLINPANTINATLYKKLNFVFLRDIDPVGNIIQVPNVMEVNPRSRSRRSRNSSTTSKPIPTRSTSPRPATAPRSICPANCSR